MRLRECVRALICDPSFHVLLVNFDWEDLDLEGGVWATPGGGVERGETRLGALQRELKEEIGLAVTSLGPEVWTRNAVWPMSGWDGTTDHIHLYRLDRFEPNPAFSTQQLEAENIRAIRWWSPDEIANHRAVFAPRSLPSLLDRLQRHGVPERPVRISGL